MPLYEFYCKPCHTIFTFRSQRVDTVTTPPCPICKQPLRREVSRFAHIIKEAVPESNATNETSAINQHGERLAEAAERLGTRLQALENEDADPREAVKVMRDMAEASGLRFNAEVREAMARIEAGADPESIDEEFAAAFESDNPFEETPAAKGGSVRTLIKRLRQPRRDPTWHEY